MAATNKFLRHVHVAAKKERETWPSTGIYCVVAARLTRLRSFTYNNNEWQGNEVTAMK